jgi:diaminopimelate epimerase
MRAERYADYFPKGANVNYYDFLAEDRVRILTFERGVEDFTLACGTGTGSVACTMLKKGLLPEKYLIAHNPGGTLRVRLETEGDEIRGIFLEGPTEVVSVHTL